MPTRFNIIKISSDLPRVSPKAGEYNDAMCEEKTGSSCLNGTIKRIGEPRVVDQKNNLYIQDVAVEPEGKGIGCNFCSYNKPESRQ